MDLSTFINQDTKHIICFSNGMGSALVAIEVVRRYGKDNVVLLNHGINPNKEEQDIRRFGKEVADYLQLPIVYANFREVPKLEDLPDQFDVCLEKKGFKKPNSADAFCTYKLKTEPFYLWLNKFCSHQNCVIYYGFDEKENHRKVRKEGILLQDGWMSDFPLFWKERTIYSTEEIGIKPPCTYTVYKHANCKGCLKAGIQHWYVTYCSEYDIFCKAKDTEKKLGYTILRRSVAGKVMPYSLERFELIFKKMKEAGIPASEHYDAQQFKKDLKKFRVNEHTQNMPCDCSIN